MTGSRREIALRTTSELAVAEEWALVLSSDGLSPQIWPAREGFVVGVPPAQEERAADLLAMHERDNRAPPSETGAPDARIDPTPWLTGVAAGFALLVFHAAVRAAGSRGGWIEWGRVDAERIPAGEIWRAVTALTLHTDIPHVLGNAVFLALLLGALAHAQGSGLAFLLAVISGAIGNLLNALARGALYSSVGASTAIFGIVGALCVLAVKRRRTVKGARGAWIPAGAGLALLAMLGVGRGSDLGAHLLGLFSGGAIEILIPGEERPRGGRALQWALGIAAIALVALSWAAALRLGQAAAGS